MRERVVTHPDDVVDLTIGTSVDSVPSDAQAALDVISDTYGYSLTVGTVKLRVAACGWLERHRGVCAETDVPPTTGLKEIMALLPSLPGLGAIDMIGPPRVSYPAYGVGARLAGVRSVPVDMDADPSTRPAMNMPQPSLSGNPNGHMFGVERLRAIFAWVRERGVVVASDECHVKLTQGVLEAPSILSERVCGDDVAGLPCLYLSSKQPSMAGYRVIFSVGDPVMIGPIVEIRKHAGFLMSGPVQVVMMWALGDDAHVAKQRAVYAHRYEKSLAVLDAAGLANDSLFVVGLYIWVMAEWPAGGVAGLNRDGGSVAEASTGRDIIRTCVELGIVVVPGDFYGRAGRNRMRISFTATGSVIDEVVRRLSCLPEAL